MRIELHIDRLVLDGVGVSARQAGDVHAAVTAELTALLQAAPATGWQQSRRDRRAGADVVQVGPALPARIARSVFTAVQAHSSQGLAAGRNRTGGRP